jgi:hypothetical protein
MGGTQSVSQVQEVVQTRIMNVVSAEAAAAVRDGVRGTRW